MIPAGPGPVKEALYLNKGLALNQAAGIIRSGQNPDRSHHELPASGGSPPPSCSRLMRS